MWVTCSVIANLTWLVVSFRATKTGRIGKMFWQKNMSVQKKDGCYLEQITRRRENYQNKQKFSTLTFNWPGEREAVIPACQCVNTLIN